MSYRVMLVEMSPSGGLFQFGFQLGRSLATRGHDVTLLTGPGPELESDVPGMRIDESLPTWHAGETQAGNTVYRKVRRVVRALRHALAMVVALRIIRRERPDVVFLQPMRFVLDAWMMRALRYLAPATVRVLFVHEPRPLAEHKRSGSLYKDQPWSDRVKRKAMHAMDLLFVLGEKTERETHEIWEPRSPVVVVPHGDESVFRGGAPLVPVRETGPVVLFFGIWTRHKGIDLLLEAFDRVRTRVEGAELLVCGSVTNDIDFGAVEARARQIPGVELRPEYIDMKDVPALFSRARVVAVPYLRASQSGVVHLAQTFERPVIASDVGDIPQAVPDGRAGLVVPPGDEDALTEALERLLTDAELAQRMGADGHARLSGEGSWDEVGDKVLASIGALGSRAVARAGRSR